MLSVYLDKAKAVVQMNQVRPGRAVHVRLSGETDGSNTRRGGDEISRTGVASSYALWAVTGRF